MADSFCLGAASARTAYYALASLTVTGGTRKARPLDDERVVVVHDYLTQRGGAERVVLAIMKAFPHARLITSFYEPAQTFPDFAGYDIRTSWLNKVSPLRKDPRLAFPLLARAFSELYIPDADFVICSSSGWAHGVRTPAPKVVYCHNPPRWLHQTSDYAAGQPLPARLLLEVLRTSLTRWDRQAAATATAYLANSTVVRERVLAAYGVEADVLPPPIGIDPGGAQEPVPGVQPGFLLTVSRARGYKNSGLVAEAVSALPGQRLVVVGGLPERAAGTWDERITGLRDLSDPQLRWLYANCTGLVAVGREDFGLTPLEANAFGRPVACLRAGGYLDTVRPGQTGVFIERPTVEGVLAGLRELRATHFSETAIRDHAQRFSPDVFADRLRTIVGEVRALRRIPVQRSGTESRTVVA